MYTKIVLTKMQYIFFKRNIDMFGSVIVACIENASQAARQIHLTSQELSFR